MSKTDKLEVNIDNCKTIVKDIIINYCSQNNIKENDIPPAIWIDILDELHDVLFKQNPQLLKDVPAINNAYNKDKVLIIYKIYRRISNSHCQEVSLKGFLDMTGIDKQTIYNWKKGDGLNATGFDLHEKIMEDNEQSLEAMLHDKRYNPMKVLPSLNNKHHWNLPGVSKEREPQQRLTQEQIAAKYGIETNEDYKQLKPPDIPDLE